MKRNFLILLLMVVITCVESAGQINSNDQTPKGVEDRNVTKTLKEEVVVKPSEKPKEVKEEVFRSVEQMPQFPGGDIELLRYLKSHLNYSKDIVGETDQKVIVQLLIWKTGEVKEVKLVRLCEIPVLNEEALRVCKSLPNFIPGRQNGVPVSVLYLIPVTFKGQ